jgi:3-hydroxyacyl-CoA dehydrogenase
MWYADAVGLKKVYDRVCDFCWEPAPLLKRLAAEGSSFANWDAARG